MNMKKIIAGVGAFALSLTVVGVAMAATTTDSQNTSATVEENLTLDCAASIDVDGGTPIVADGATIESNTTTCAVTTNDAAGYHLQVRETTQLTHTDASTTLPNFTPTWTGANAAQYTAGGGLAFRVSNVTGGSTHDRATLWGADTACGNAATAAELYAGLPSGLVDILEEDDYVSGTSTSTICYAVSVGSTQKAGEYSGTVEYSVTTGA